MIPVPQKIFDLEKKIEEIQKQKNKVVRSQRYEEAGRLREIEKELISELEKAKMEWEQFAQDHDISEINRLCLRIRNGKVEVLLEQENGKVIFVDGSQKLENDLYVFATSKWTKILRELENLINKIDLQEQELQDFFEAYPELVLDDKFDFPIPQAAIVSAEDVEWRADFVLIPKHQFNFAKILELKLPSEDISIKAVNGHSRFSAKLYKAINQLRDYYEAFNNDSTKEIFKKKYKTEVFKPDLQLLFGRRKTIQNSKALLELQRRNNLEIKDWDTLLEELKKKYK